MPISQTNKKLAIFDMDGTIYLGKNLIPGALEALNALSKAGVHIIFFTNNSSHDLNFYEKKMNDFGFKCNVAEHFYSSTEVTIEHLKSKGMKKLYIVGNKSMKQRFAPHFELVDHYEKGNRIDAVVCGFCTELVYQDLQDACLYLLTNDCGFYATNGDYRCPIEDGLYIPDCGGMIEWLRLATGKEATVLGKPSPVVVTTLMERFGVSKEETFVIGDRLYTDILVGLNAGVDAICVLSGEASMEDVENYPHKPTEILKSIADLPRLLEIEQ